MKPHVHTPKCLSAWGTCPGIEYEDWLRVVDGISDQNSVWQSHEFYARRDQRFYAESAERGLVDLGGEG